MCPEDQLNKPFLKNALIKKAFLGFTRRCFHNLMSLPWMSSGLQAWSQMYILFQMKTCYDTLLTLSEAQSNNQES